VFAKLQPEDDAGDRQHRQVVTCQLFVACGDATKLLEPVETLLDTMPFPIGPLVERTPPPFGAFAGNDHPNAMLTQIPAERTTAVAFIRADPLRTQARSAPPASFDRSLFQQRLGWGRLMLLPGGQTAGERTALPVGAERDLGREAASASAERLLVLPPFAPAAC